MAEAPAGFGAMKAKKDKFELKLKGVANPGTVTVESCLGGTATGAGPSEAVRPRFDLKPG